MVGTIFSLGSHAHTALVWYVSQLNGTPKVLHVDWSIQPMCFTFLPRTLWTTWRSLSCPWPQFDKSSIIDTNDGFVNIYLKWWYFLIPRNADGTEMGLPVAYWHQRRPILHTNQLCLVHTSTPADDRLKLWQRWHSMAFEYPLEKPKTPVWGEFSILRSGHWAQWTDEDQQLPSMRDTTGYSSSCFVLNSCHNGV